MKLRSPGRARGNAAARSPRTAARPYINKATERVLRVLDAFSQAPPVSRGITELSRELGMTKNMVFRSLATLIAEGYLVRDASGSRYDIGHRLFTLRKVPVEEPDLRTVCGPSMRAMHDLSGETITLSIPVGFNSFVIDGIEGRHPIVTRVMYGRSIPLHAGPGSRAILAFLPDEEIEAFLAARQPLPRLTPTTIVDRAALWREIQTVRKRGYSIGYGDHIPHSAAVAFPVLDASRRPHGAIAVGTPETGPGWKRIRALIPAFARIMADLNERAQLISASPTVPDGG